MKHKQTGHKTQELTWKRTDRRYITSRQNPNRQDRKTQTDKTRNTNRQDIKHMHLPGIP